jgi:hypothetical protein
LWCSSLVETKYLEKNKKEISLLRTNKHSMIDGNIYVVNKLIEAEPKINWSEKTLIDIQNLMQCSLASSRGQPPT